MTNKIPESCINRYKRNKQSKKSNRVKYNIEYFVESTQTWKIAYFNCGSYNHAKFVLQRFRRALPDRSFMIVIDRRKQL
jgi:hypothetical protein